MNIRKQPRSSAQAFTLIELLTVIAIIAVLMGLLFPAIGAVKDQAKKAQAKNDVTQIITAVKQYYTEYGKYPPVVEGSSATTGEPDVVVGDDDVKPKAANSALFNTLRAIDAEPNKDHKLNPRRIVFFEGKAVSNASQPRAGFADSGTSEKKGCFFDPWGNQYAVIMDTNYDDLIDVDQVYQDTEFAAESRPRTGVGAFSVGKDNVIGDKEKFVGKFRDGTKVADDVLSWQ